MDYLSMEKDIFYSIINMKLRDFYCDLKDLSSSENIDFELLLEKINSFGFIYDDSLNRLVF